jgi:hypothetical protein
MAKRPQNAEGTETASADGKLDGEKRTFKAVHNIVLAGRLHLAGSEIDLAIDEHAMLAASGSVEGDWGD